MKTIPFLLSSVIAALVSSQANGSVTTAANATQQICPKGAGLGDGCDAAAGSVRSPNLFMDPNLSPGHGRSYDPKYWAWNIAGVDYGVGVPTGMILKDPATARLDGTGCHYNRTGSAAKGPKLSCGNGAVSVLGFEFGPVGGHLATVLEISNTATSADVENNHFSNDSNTFQSSVANDYALYLATPGSRFPLVFSNNTVDGACKDQNCALGDYQIVAYTAGAITLERNALRDLPDRITMGCPGSCGGGAFGDLTVKWNLLIGIQMTTALHGEFILYLGDQVQQSTQTHTIYQYNTLIEPNTAPDAIMTSMLNSAGGAAPFKTVFKNTLMDHNTLLCTPGTGPHGYVCSTAIYFANGQFQNVTITNNRMTRGAYAYSQNLGLQSDFTAFIDGSGILHVTAVTPNTGPNVGTDNWHLISAGQKLWFNHADSGITVGSQLTGATGLVGTYNTTGLTGAVPRQGMVGYGIQGDGAIEHLSISGNIDPSSGATANVFENNNMAHTPLP